MHYLSKHLVVSIMICLVALVISNCATTNKITMDWEETLKADTPESYRKFITKYPNSKLTLEAAHRERERYWDKTKEINTIKSYNEFLERYPMPHIYYDEIVERKTAITDYNATIIVNTVESYERFLKKHPSSVFAEEIRLKVETIEYKTALEDNTIESYLEFKRNHAESSYIKDIDQKIYELYLFEAKTKDSIPAYEQFLNKYPDSEYKNQFNNSIKVLEAEKPFALKKIKKVQIKYPRLISARSETISGYKKDSTRVSKIFKDVSKRIKSIMNDRVKSSGYTVVTENEEAIVSVNYDFYYLINTPLIRLNRTVFGIIISIEHLKYGYVYEDKAMVVIKSNQDFEKYYDSDSGYINISKVMDYIDGNLKIKFR